MDLANRPLKILTVDDDAVDRLFLRRTLQDTGLKLADIAEVDCGKAAIAALDNAFYDCVFLDYRLPDLNGLQLVQQIRAQGTLTPLVVLTGQGDQETAVALMKAGASDYVDKSRLNTDALAHCIRSALRIYEAEQAARQAQQEVQVSNALLLQQNQALEEHRQEIQRQNLEVMRAYRLKSEFLATMSHELRTPLNAIIGFSQLLARRREERWTQQQTEMVKRIYSNAHNLLGLLNEILDFSKLEAQRLELRPGPVNLAELAENTIAEMHSLAEQKSLKLSLQLHLKDPMIINDPLRLRQIFINLLSNGIKFTDAGSVLLQISSAPGAPTDEVLITVTDTGSGIASDDLPYIFEAFRQVDQSHSRRHGGTGLGLAIVEAIVALMGGKIWAESAPQVGSTFYVQFPRVVQTAS
ncbi:MAG: ATP-binding protein [Leptolyngbyaceae cyanobacterium]|mgnify:CR=1 FL=1